jgi:8-oxo-dGTP pyrophosphatase MutT (NUDIX family)
MASSFSDRVRESLAQRTKQPWPTDGVAAAVLIMLFEKDGEPWVVFTKRSDSVRHHKGEISFPGGVRDPEDASLADTAIREAVEELGVDPNDVEILGDLDDLPTFVSGFVISPFVALVPEKEVYDHSPDEIAEVIRVPLSKLAEIQREAIWERDGHRFTTQVFDVDGNVIWGATGRILSNFLEAVGPALGLPAPAPAE